MQKKKICLVTNWYPTKDNPFQGQFIREQMIALKDYYDFIVFHYCEGNRHVFDKVSVNFVNEEYNIKEFDITMYRTIFYNRFTAKMYDKNSRRSWVADKVLYSALRTFKGEDFKSIDYFFNISAQGEGYIAELLADLFDKPYVLSEHGPFPWVGRLVSEENRKAIEKANLFLAISKDKVRQILMQNLKLSNIKYIGNMIDDDLYTYRKSDNEVKTFIAVGSNSFYKNYKMLLDTLIKLKNKTDKNFKLMLVGFDANKGYAKPSNELVDEFTNSSIGNNVKFIPFVTHEEMPICFNKADAFIMTSIQEGQPMAALEAAASGLPIFSTRCGGVEDYIDDKMGRLVDILDSETLSNYLKEYLEEIITFDNSYIRNKTVEKYGKKAFIKNFVDAFSSIK